MSHKTKVFLLSALVVFTTIIANGQNNGYDTIRYARDYYQKRVTKFKSEPIKTGRIIFLGNSITEYANWPTLLADTTAINRGIAADNTFGVLERLEDVIIRKPRKLFIEIGINDIAQNIPTSITANNIHTIAERVRAASPNTTVYVLSALPTNDNVQKQYPELFQKNERATQLNKELMANAEKGKFTYIDFNKELQDKVGKLDTKYANADGLHLNEAGYQRLIDLLRKNKYLP